METAVIICNGPSLKAVPNEWLDRFYTFGSNRVFLKYTPKHMTVVDVKMVHTAKLQKEMVIGLAGAEEVCLSVDSSKMLAKRYPDGFPSNFEILEWWNYYDANNGNKLLPVFAKNPGEPLVSGGTVTYGMLQLAWRRGFKRILLVGLNHTFRDPRGDHFDSRYNEGVGIPYEKENTKDGEFGRGAGKWWWSEKQFVAKTNMFYYVASQFYAQNGGEIINCTPDTKCSVFPIDDWRAY